MGLLGEKSYTVTRYPTVLFEGGVAKHPDGEAPTTFGIRGTVRPLDDKTAEALPEAVRTNARFKFYSRSLATLRLHDIAAPYIPDTIDVDGESLHVFALADNSSAMFRSPLNHRRYVLVKPSVPRR